MEADFTSPCLENFHISKPGVVQDVQLNCLANLFVLCTLLSPARLCAWGCNPQTIFSLSSSWTDQQHWFLQPWSPPESWMIGREFCWRRGGEDTQLWSQRDQTGPARDCYDCHIKCQVIDSLSVARPLSVCQTVSHLTISVCLSVRLPARHLYIYPSSVRPSITNFDISTRRSLVMDTHILGWKWPHSAESLGASRTPLSSHPPSPQWQRSHWQCCCNSHLNPLDPALAGSHRTHLAHTSEACALRKTIHMVW